MSSQEGTSGWDIASSSAPLEGTAMMMGGNSGDGILAPTNDNNTMVDAAATAGAAPRITSFMMPSGTPQQSSSFPTQPPPMAGSITRFASPEMMPPQPTSSSYAERSQQAYYSAYPPAQPPPPPPQQQQSSNVYGASSSISSLGGGGGSSYAARSQQAYQVQQQPPTPPSNVYMGGPQSFPQQQQSNVYATPTMQSYASSVPTMQQQQQAPLPGSYAARSTAALYGQQPQPPTMAQPQQPTTGMYPQQQQQPVLPQQQQQQQPQPQQMMRATGSPPAMGMESTHQQQKFLTEASSKVQEHAYYMKQAMDQHNLPLVLDRAAHMVGELGGPPHGQHHHHQNNNSSNPQSQSSFPSQANTGHAAKLTPKNYYELYMRALQDMPIFEEYLFNLASKPNAQQQQQQPAQPQFPSDTIRIVENIQQLNTPIMGGDNAPRYTMRQLYDCVQYCPRVVSRLYLQIAAGSALIKSGECGAKFVMRDLQNAVKCEQNPVRGLFLRHYLLTALRDKLPDVIEEVQSTTTTQPTPENPTLASPDQEQQEQQKEEGDNDDDSAEGYLEQRNKVIAEDEKGTVRDSIDFILANFMEMNKLWVRIQHLPGEGNNKDVRKRRERERNDLRILVGTNLVRLSQLECVTSKMYGEIILSPILEHIVIAGDPLSQAYLMDCLVQVFPDEYHIETLPILLNVCPRLRDKVNIRTILQGLMDRLANYLAEEELLDETDTNEVKKALARDAFSLFEECIQKVYNARGPKLTSKEVIRLQTSLLHFSIRLYPGNMEQVQRCIGECVEALRQANASYDDIQDGTIASNVPPRIKPLDDASVVELEKLLSIPLNTLALKVLEFEQYSQLIGFLPWANRREVSVKMLKAVDNVGTAPQSVKEIEQLFAVIEPLVRDENIPNSSQAQSGLTPSSTFVSPHGSATRTSTLMAGLGVNDASTGPIPIQSLSLSDQTYQDPSQIQRIQQENALVSKLVHLLNHDIAGTLFEMLQVARNHISQPGSGRQRVGQTLVAVVFAALRLARRVFDADESKELKIEKKSDENDDKDGGIDAGKAPNSEECESENVSSREESIDIPASTGHVETQSELSSTTTNRKIFAFIQETINLIGKCDSEKAVKLYLDVALSADYFAVSTKCGTARTDYALISYEFMCQAFALYDEQISDGKGQVRCISAMTGTLLASCSLSKEEYESLTTKTAQYSARVLKKSDQCHLVALCAHLFYPVGNGEEKMKYCNQQRCLECLQRSLKLADACTSTNPTNARLFVDLLEHYIFFFEKNNPLITHAYISGLVALVREHLSSQLGGEVETKNQFLDVIRYLKEKKTDERSSALFGPILLGD